jgi:hypothetical protein
MRRKGFPMLRPLKLLAMLVAILFVAPAVATAGWWSLVDRPGTWRSADWSSSGLLPAAPAREEAAVYVLAARTGGLKGAFSVHSWIVLKRPGSTRYERYDKVGWGSPIRRDGWAADGRWYSNMPETVAMARGERARDLLARMDAAIASYPHARNGDYRIWPGPNSNSFVAHVLRGVPELDATLPPNATGRDYVEGLASFDLAPDGRDLHVTLAGLAGFAVGARSGFEVHFMGLVAGLDIARPALKIPAFGRVPLWPES